MLGKAFLPSLLSKGFNLFVFSMGRSALSRHRMGTPRSLEKPNCEGGQEQWQKNAE